MMNPFAQTRLCYLYYSASGCCTKRGFRSLHLNLCQSGERRGVVGFFLLKQLQSLHRAWSNYKSLQRGGFGEVQHLSVSVIKLYCGLRPPAVMREISPQGQADFIYRNRAAKINRQHGIRIAVDAPALVRPVPWASFS